MNTKILFTLFLLFAVSNCITNSWLCTNCICGDKSATYSRGDNVPVCIHYLVQSTSTTAPLDFYRAAYYPQVDVYTAIELNGGYANFATNASVQEVRIIIQVGNIESQTMPFMNRSNNAVSAYSNVFGAVLGIVSGAPTEIVWDNRCANCGTGACVTTLFANTQQTTICTNKNACTGSVCDPKIYISWMGSDKIYNRMTSAGLRINRFTSVLDDVYSKAAALVNY